VANGEKKFCNFDFSAVEDRKFNIKASRKSLEKHKKDEKRASLKRRDKAEGKKSCQETISGKQTNSEKDDGFSAPLFAFSDPRTKVCSTFAKGWMGIEGIQANNTSER
jgi:hypothetical protein